MNRPSLHVLVVASDAETGAFAARVLEDNDDRAAVASGVPDALHRLGRESFDVALISLALPRGDGLALIHHLRALHSDIDVIVMAHPSDIEESAHAMALGVLASVVLPLSGDGLMVAVDRARERRVLLAERERLTAEGAQSRRRTATYARCAAFVAETDANTVATRILDACAAELDAAGGAIFVPAEADDRLHRAAVLGDASRWPAWIGAGDVAELDPGTIVDRNGDRVRVLLMGDSHGAVVVDLEHTADRTLDDSLVESLRVVAALGTAALSAARKVEAIAKTGLKDPDTSAYTFAYFGDVAGREIDRASRHGRKFALLTVALDALLDAGAAHRSPRELVDIRRAVTDAMLMSLRDSDVVARVEDDELYVLLPESGLLGSLAARSRIIENLRAVSAVNNMEPAVGVAVYPADGRDLARLLRASRRRADRARDGVWRRLGLARHPFWTAVERLLGGDDDAGIGRDGTVALHADLRAAHDDTALARHAAFPRALVSSVAEAMANDALAHDLPGTLYVAGDAAAASAVGRAVAAAEQPKLRAWSLGPAPTGSAPAERIHIRVDDPRLEDRVLLLALTELGGYAMIARPLSDGGLLAYHSSDLDLVDGLVRAAQTTYRLQPEVR